MRVCSVATLLAISVLFAGLPATASRTAGEASLTIRLISTPGRTVVRDRPPKGLQSGDLSKGDSISGTSILRNAVPQFGKPKGAVVGSDTYSITATSPTHELFKVQVKLPGGTLRVQRRGSVLKSSNTVPVIGGTGTFAGARGCLCEASDLSGNRTLNVYRLRLP